MRGVSKTQKHVILEYFVEKSAYEPESDSHVSVGHSFEALRPAFWTLTGAGPGLWDLGALHRAIQNIKHMFLHNFMKMYWLETALLLSLVSCALSKPSRQHSEAPLAPTQRP